MGLSIKYVTLFLANFDPPPPCHTLSHIPGPPKRVRHISGTPPFLVGLVHKSRTKASVQILSQLFAGVLFGGFVRGLLSGRFCPGWFLSVPLLSKYICYDRQLNIALNFMFDMYKCHKLSHLLGHPPPSSVTYFMDGPLVL